MSYIIKIAIQQAVKKQNCFVVFTTIVGRSESVSLPMSGKVARLRFLMRLGSRRAKFYNMTLTKTP